MRENVDIKILRLQSKFVCTIMSLA